MTRLSKEDKAVILQAANEVWQEIGYDCLEAGGGEDIPRSQVIELVIDAGRLRENLEFRQRRADLAKAVFDMKYEKLQRLLREAFPCTRYGM